MAGGDDQITVEVVYALPEQQSLVVITLHAGATLGEAVKRSGLPLMHPGIDAAHGKVGIFGRRVPLDTVLRSGDRVEIYRTLTADPKEARRRRARKLK